MKTKILYISIIVSFLFACNDKFMDKVPLSSLSSPAFWNTETDLQQYNNNLYNSASGTSFRMLIGHYQDFYYYGKEAFDGMTDNDVRAWANYYPQYNKIRAGKLFSNQTTAEFAWNNNHFSFIRAINIGLANYDKAALPIETINKYKAEAHLFRGWAVADKVSLYGDFPWIDKELNIDSPELFADRTPRETVMDHVLDDLNFACENLPDDWGDGNAPGRLNRWNALLIKSRICLFEGTWRKYHGGSNPELWLQASASAAEELMEKGPYKLYSTGDVTNDYNAIFRMEDLSGVDEVMYWRRYKEGLVTNRFQDYYSIFAAASKSVVEDYLCMDGKPISISPLYQGDAIYEKLFENRDPRLRQTVLHPDDLEKYDLGGLYTQGIGNVPVLIGQAGPVSYTGYHQIKYYNRKQHILDTKGLTPSLILRFGEALLNYAEAKAELGTITQEDLDVSINKLRDRVGMPHIELNNVPVDPRYVDWGVSPLLVEIRRERRVELMGEGFRFDDIRRWKLGEKILSKKDYGMRWDAGNRARFDPDHKSTVQYEEVVPGSGIEYLCPFKGSEFENPVFEAKHYLWPVPLGVLTLNPNMTQNPGW